MGGSPPLLGSLQRISGSVAIATQSSLHLYHAYGEQVGWVPTGRICLIPGLSPLPFAQFLPEFLLIFRTMAAHFRLGPFPGRMPAGAQGVASLQQLSTPTFVWLLSSLETGLLPAF